MMTFKVKELLLKTDRAYNFYNQYNTKILRWGLDRADNAQTVREIYFIPKLAQIVVLTEVAEVIPFGAVMRMTLEDKDSYREFLGLSKDVLDDIPQVMKDVMDTQPEKPKQGTFSEFFEEAPEAIIGDKVENPAKPVARFEGE